MIMTHFLKLTLCLGLLAKVFVGCEQYESFLEDQVLQCGCSLEGEEISPAYAGIVGKWQYEGYYNADNIFNETPAPPEGYGEGFYIELKGNGGLNGRAAPNIIAAEEVQPYENNGLNITRAGIATDIGSPHPEWEEQMAQGLNDAQCYNITNGKETLHISYQPDNGQCKTMKFERKTED